MYVHTVSCCGILPGVWRQGNPPPAPPERGPCVTNYLLLCGGLSRASSDRVTPVVIWPGVERWFDMPG